MPIQVTVNMVTAEVNVNSQDIQCEVNFTPAQAEIQCCGNGILGVPGDGDLGDILTKTGAGATGYAWQPASGLSTDSVAITAEAGQNISATRLVKIVSGIATYFDPTTDAEAAGIATTAATTGNPVTVTLSGKVEIAGWGLTPGALYWAGANGQIFSTDPANVLSKQIGVADDANTLILNIKESFFLN